MIQTTALGSPSYDRLVWRPDAFGSGCFLVSGAVAYAVVAGGLLRRTPRTLDGAVAAVNLAGCVAFGVSAVAAGGRVVRPAARACGCRSPRPVRR